MSDEYVLTQMHVFFWQTKERRLPKKQQQLRKSQSDNSRTRLLLKDACQVSSLSFFFRAWLLSLHVFICWANIWIFVLSNISELSNSTPVGSDCLHWVRMEKELYNCSWGPLFLSDHYDWKYVQYKYLYFIFCCVFLGVAEVDWLFPHSSTDQTMFMCIHWLV